MSRGILEHSDIERISKETPDLSALNNLVLRLSPDVLSINYHPESRVPAASVCFQDTLHTLAEARYALHEVFAHRIWYMEKKDPPNEITANFFGRFYADDAALRLYSAGEHLANGIINMLEIDDQELKCYKQQRVSQQSIVGNYLCKQKPSHLVTKVLTKLAKSKEWSAAIEYRNRWVHEQPPTVAGMGIVHKRGERWKPLPNGGYTLGIGGGDEPEYSTEDLVGFIKPAMFQFKDTFTTVVRFYIGMLESRGVSFRNLGINVTLLSDYLHINKGEGAQGTGLTYKNLS